jgi:DNA-binding transcriptional ArsR family regulator
MVDVEDGTEEVVARIAGVIGEPARTRMLYCLLDHRARTSTELAVVAGVSPSTASVHLNRLRDARLVKVVTQGRHHYYSLSGTDVARVLEGLSVLAGGARQKFEPRTPDRLRKARTCYDHIAGNLGVYLHDSFNTRGWLALRDEQVYDLTPLGAKGFESLGIDVTECRQLRRRFVFPCLDWSERRYHMGGSVASEFLKLALKRQWVTQDLDGRALSVTNAGRRELLARFGVQV